MLFVILVWDIIQIIERGGYVIYALLTTLSAVTPTATPIPTAIPTPTAFPISIAENLTGLPMWLEILGIAASIILGGAALFISINASRFAKKQQKREEEMRQREAKIAVMDKAFEIYHFFNREFQGFVFTEGDDITYKFIYRESEIRYIAKMIFSDKTFERIDNILSLLFEERLLYQHFKSYSPKEINDWIDTMSKRHGFTKFDVSTDDVSHILCMPAVFITGEIEEIFEQYRLNL